MARQIPFGQPFNVPAVGQRDLMIEDIFFMHPRFRTVNYNPNFRSFNLEWLQERTLAQLERIWAFAIGRHGMKPSDFPYFN